MPATGTPATAGGRRTGDSRDTGDTRDTRGTGRTGGREVGQGHRGLLGVGGGQHDTDPVAQVVQLEPARGVVLTQQRDQALALSVPE